MTKNEIMQQFNEANNIFRNAQEKLYKAISEYEDTLNEIISFNACLYSAKQNDDTTKQEVARIAEGEARWRAAQQGAHAMKCLMD